MTTLELEAKKQLLAQAVLNEIDSEDTIDEIQHILDLKRAINGNELMTRVDVRLKELFSK